MTEIKLITFGLFFYLFLGFGIELFVNEDVAQFQLDTDLEDVMSSADDSFLTSASYNFATGLFGIFGLDLGGELSLLPDVLNHMLSLFGLLLIISFTMWVFQNVGQIIPFT